MGSRSDLPMRPLHACCHVPFTPCHADSCALRPQGIELNNDQKRLLLCGAITMHSAHLQRKGLPPTGPCGTSPCLTDRV